jgi:hypothetical protein
MGIGGASHEHHDQAGIEILCPFGELTPIHLGHSKVSDEQMHQARVGLQKPKGGPAALAAPDSVPERSHHSRAGCQLVIDHEDQGIER